MQKTVTRFLSLLAALCLLLSGAALADNTGALPLPDVTLTDQYGTAHNLSDYRGKIVFLNFWATWCPPCVAEMPDFEKLYHELGENGKDVVILGVAAPDPNGETEENEAGVISFLAGNSITYPVLMDNDCVLWRRYPSQYIPFSLFFLPDGTAATFTMPDGTEGDMIVGGIDSEYFRKTLESLLLLQSFNPNQPV